MRLDDQFTIEKLRNLTCDEEPSNETTTFKVFADRLIFQMFEVNRTGNAIVYQTAVNRLITYCGRDVSFTEINYQLLDEFKHHLITSGLKQNSIGNYFRSIRAIA